MVEVQNPQLILVKASDDLPTRLDFYIDGKLLGFVQFMGLPFEDYYYYLQTAYTPNIWWAKTWNEAFGLFNQLHQLNQVEKST